MNLLATQLFTKMWETIVPIKSPVRYNQIISTYWTANHCYHLLLYEGYNVLFVLPLLDHDHAGPVTFGRILFHQNPVSPGMKWPVNTTVLWLKLTEAFMRENRVSIGPLPTWGYPPPLFFWRVALWWGILLHLIRPNVPFMSGHSISSRARNSKWNSRFNFSCWQKHPSCTLINIPSGI